MASQWCDCKPSQYEDDRTHRVVVWQAHYDGEPGDEPVWEETADAEICCSHNDAVAMAEIVAAGVDVPMRKLGKSGHWKGSAVEQGYGDKGEVWIWRGPGEEDYDAAHLAEIEAHNARLAADA